jgi:tripartite-type tricarboxylate transporter receptor subunit TctC
MEMFDAATGIKMVHVPYTGAGPAIVGLLSGQVDVVATGPATIVQHVKGGKVRALAHWGDVRLVTLPDVPSLKESGTNVEYAQWSGLFVPAGTPEPVVKRLREAAKAAAIDPRVKEVLLTAGSPIQYLDAPEFQRYVDADAAKMADVVKRIGKVE